MSADIERLRAVGRAATEGPWRYIGSSSSNREFGHRAGSSATYAAPDEAFSLRVDHVAYGRQAVADAEFCATARNEWDALLDEVEALRAKVAGALDALDRTHRHGEWQTRQAVRAALADEQDINENAGGTE